MEKTGSARILLTEIILVFLFFLVSILVILEMFVYAKEKSDESQERTYAYAEMQRILETWEETEEYFVNWEKTADGIYQMYYDREWAECSKEEGVYMIKTTIRKDTATLQTITVQALSIETKTLIGELYTCCYKEGIQ